MTAISLRSDVCSWALSESSSVFAHIIVRFFLSWRLTPRYSLKTTLALPGYLLGKLVKLTLRTLQ